MPSPYTLTANSGTFSLTGENATGKYGAIQTDGVGLHNALTPTVGVGVTSGVGLSPAPAYAYHAGAAVTELVRLLSIPTGVGHLAMTASDQAILTQALTSAWAVTKTEGLGLSAAVNVAVGVTVLQQLYLHDAIAPTAHFGQTLAETLLLHDALARLIGGTVSETLATSATLTPLWKLAASATDAVGLSGVFANTLLLNVSVADGVKLHDADILKMIYSGVIADGVSITAGYIAPTGNLTTWAINTRTSAVTEYDNFAFASFAALGHKIVGASSTGLYELDGATDDGASIVAAIQSGLMQVAGSHFTAFKCAYLGVDSAGAFVLRLEAGDGRTYDYAVQSQQHMTTRVNFGKGLRSRYFSFTLTAVDGHEFTLDNIEFVPITSQRRV
jgi:hypothetical protein